MELSFFFTACSSSAVFAVFFPVSLCSASFLFIAFDYFCSKAASFLTSCPFSFLAELILSRI